MKRSLVFLATACALCVAWVLCKGMQADTRTVEIEGEAIPYICQNEKVYVYLKVNCTPFVRQYDILNNKWGNFYAKRSTK